MIKPRQTDPKTDTWFENNVKYWSQRLSKPYISSTDLEYLQKIVSGVLDYTKYTYITNQYGIDRANNMPAQLKNFDFISPIFLKWLAEYRARPFDPIVLAQDSDYINRVEQFEHEKYAESLQQVFINTLIQQGKYVEGETDENGQPINPPTHPEVIKAQSKTIKDEKSEEGQRILGHMMRELDYAQKASVMFFDFITGLIGVSFKGVNNDKPFYERVEPDRIAFAFSGNEKYGEQAEAVRYVNWYTLSEVVDKFSEFEDFTEDMLKELESKDATNYGSSSSSFNGFLTSFYRNQYGIDMNRNYTTDLVQVEHFQWTGKKKIKRVTYTNVFGESKYMDVDEDYVVEEGQEAETRWINREYEAFCIDNRYIIGKKESDYQRATYDNPNAVKKYYNCRIFMSEFRFTQAPARKLESYQEQVNVLKYQLQTIVNKNKDKLLIMPLGLLNGIKQSEAQQDLAFNSLKGKAETPLQATSDEEDTITQSLYYADATQILFVDETSPQAALAAQMIKTVDLSLGNSIQLLMNLITEVKQEAEDLIGFNRFRQAKIQATDAVSNVQQGQAQAELTTEEYFTQFNDFMEKELQGLLDLSNFCYRKGVTSTYLRSDGEIERFKIEKNHLGFVDYGIFALNGGKAKRNYEELRQLAQAFAQNGASFSMIGKLYNSNGNMNSVISMMEDMENQMQQRQEQAAQAEQQSSERIAQIDYQKHSDQVQLKLYEINSKAQIELEKLMAAENGNGDSKAMDMYIKTQQLLQQEQKNIQDAIIQSKGLDVKMQDIAVKKYVSDNQLRVAKENKP
jgi:hypothetical protein